MRIKRKKRRVIYLSVSVITIALSIILGIIGGIIEKNANNIRSESDTLKTSIDAVRNNTETAKNELDKKEAEKEALNVELEAKKEIASFKTNPGAMLTFDDGPNSNTAAILDFLKENNIRATFYIIASQAEGGRYDEELRRMTEEGHTVGIHCYNHKYAEIYASEEAFFADFDKASEIIESLCGEKPVVSRLPGGTASAKSFCKKYSGDDALFGRIMQNLSDRGYTVSDWNIDTRDWDSSVTSSDIAATVINGAERRLSSEYKVALVLMHNTKKSLEALSEIVPSLINLGYNFKPMKSNGYVVIQRLS